MELNKDRLKILYDREADVLYVTKGAPEHSDYVEYTRGCYSALPSSDETTGGLSSAH